MKIKDRFRKALFAFFKDEILKNVGYNGHIHNTQIIHKHLKLNEIKSEILIDNTNEQVRYGEPTGVLYENALRECKEKLFEEAIKHIHIDVKSVMDSHIYDGRAIRVSLYFGSTES